MLVDKLCTVIDLVVDHNKQIPLCVVLSNILVGVLLVRHFGCGREEARRGREKVRRVVLLSVSLETADQCAQEWQREKDTARRAGAEKGQLDLVVDLECRIGGLRLGRLRKISW